MYAGLEEVADNDNLKGYTQKDLFVDWDDHIPDLTKKLKSKYGIDQQETLTINQWIIMFNNALEEQEEKYIKMLMRLALTNQKKYLEV